MTETTTDISNPPRPITPNVARRAWAEPNVRLWWLSALALILIVVYLIVIQLIARQQETDLLREGEPVTATVHFMPGRHQQTRNVRIDVQLKYTLADGRELIDQSPRTLGPTNDGSVLHTKDPLRIRVDKTDPTRWTEDRPAGSMLNRLATPLVLSLVAMMLVGVAWLKRSSVLNVWRNGLLTDATVIGVRTSALAPRSQQLKITLANDTSNRVVSLMHPRSAGQLSTGDTLEVIAPHNRPDRAIEAHQYSAGL